MITSSPPSLNDDNDTHKLCKTRVVLRDICDIWNDTENIRMAPAQGWHRVNQESTLTMNTKNGQKTHSIQQAVILSWFCTQCQAGRQFTYQGYKVGSKACLSLGWLVCCWSLPAK